MTTKPTDIGMNRTGIATSPIDSRRVVEAAGESLEHDGRAIESERVQWARSADPLGSVPPPGTVKGAAKTLLQKLEGHQPAVFVDKLGERLAYERAATRLYEALLAKFEAAHVHVGGPTRAELEEIHAQEHAHVLLVVDVIRQLGADPTALTPSADVVGVAGTGWVQVLADPRTTLTQCLDVMLIAEQGDVEGWNLLIELADELGLDDLASRFRAASDIEQIHARRVRGWLSAAVLGQIGARPTPPLETPTRPRT